MIRNVEIRVGAEGVGGTVFKDHIYMEVKRMVAKVNFKIFWVFKAIWEDSSNEKHDMGWKGQKGSMANLGF